MTTRSTNPRAPGFRAGLEPARRALSGDDVSVRDVIRALGDASFAALLFIPVLELLPFTSATRGLRDPVRHWPEGARWAFGQALYGHDRGGGVCRAFPVDRGRGRGQFRVMNRDHATETLNAMFAPWVRALDIRIDDIGDTGATLSIPITGEIARVGGIVSGQALAALADTAMVFAIAGHFDDFKPVATTNLDTVFLRPGSGARISCRASVVRAGRAVVFAKAELRALPMEKAVATATATYMIP